MPDMLLPELLARSAERFPEKTAIMFPDEQISFGVLHQRSSMVAARLASLGIGHGDRVAILYENSLAAVVFFWGILMSGAQSVDIPSLAGTATVRRILAECKPAALAASERQLERLTNDGYELPDVIFTEGARTFPVHVQSLKEIIATKN